MTPDHGTRARYLRGCHCDDCRNAHARDCKRWRVAVGYKSRAGAEALRRVPVGPAADHLRTLRAAGMTWADIAVETGAHSEHLRKIHARVYATTHRDIAERILAIEPPTADVIDEVAIERVLTGNATVDTLTRSERHAARVEAARRGWTATEIVQRLRVSGSDARRLVEAVTS